MTVKWKTAVMTKKNKMMMMMMMTRLVIDQEHRIQVQNGPY